MPPTPQFAPSLVTWVRGRDGGKASENTLSEVLVGLHGPSQHWTVVDTLHVEHFLLHAEALDVAHECNKASLVPIETLSQNCLPDKQQGVASSWGDKLFFNAILELRACPSAGGNTIITRTRGGKIRECRLVF